jgi:2'-5' RNA ligase
VRSSGSHPSEPGAVRAFLAAALDDATRARLDRLSSGWRFPDVRLVPSANAHVTLRFLGQATAAQLERVAALVAPVAAACPAVVATASGLAVFPPRGAPRVLALSLALPAGVTTLQRACEAAARDAGFAPEPREFRPHLTLGRSEPPRPASAASDPGAFRGPARPRGPLPQRRRPGRRDVRVARDVPARGLTAPRYTPGRP